MMNFGKTLNFEHSHANKACELFWPNIIEYVQFNHADRDPSRQRDYKQLEHT